MRSVWRKIWSNRFPQSRYCYLKRRVKKIEQEDTRKTSSMHIDCQNIFLTF